MFLNLQFDESNVYGVTSKMAWGCGLIITTSCLGLIYAIASTTKAAPDLAKQALSKLEFSGVDNPVTAVLLNYRSYDTLLEIAVLLIVAVAILPTIEKKEKFAVKKSLNSDEQILASLLKWLVPFAVIVGGYLLWIGAYLPGGAFQAGAVIAGAGVALSLTEHHVFKWTGNIIRLVLVSGLAVFILAAFFNTWITGTTFEYPLLLSGQIILIIEIAATTTISSVLTLLFTRILSIKLHTPQSQIQHKESE